LTLRSNRFNSLLTPIGRDGALRRPRRVVAARRAV